MQTQIDFENVALYHQNKKQFSDQCCTLLAWLRSGRTITSAQGYELLGIVDVRARIRDLIKAGVPVAHFKKSNGRGTYKVYHL